MRVTDKDLQYGLQELLRTKEQKTIGTLSWEKELQQNSDEFWQWLKEEMISTILGPPNAVIITVTNTDDSERLREGLTLVFGTLYSAYQNRLPYFSKERAIAIAKYYQRNAQSAAMTARSYLRETHEEWFEPFKKILPFIKQPVNRHKLCILTIIALDGIIDMDARKKILLKINSLFESNSIGYFSYN